MDARLRRRVAFVALSLTLAAMTVACGGSEEPAATTLPPLRLRGTTTTQRATPRGTGTSSTRPPPSTVPGVDSRTERINQLIVNSGMTPTMAACLVDAEGTLNAPGATNPPDRTRAGVEAIARCKEAERATTSTASTTRR